MTTEGQCGTAAVDPWIDAGETESGGGRACTAPSEAVATSPPVREARAADAVSGSRSDGGCGREGASDRSETRLSLFRCACSSGVLTEVPSLDLASGLVDSDGIEAIVP
jgi:hypothetical protein